MRNSEKESRKAEEDEIIEAPPAFGLFTLFFLQFFLSNWHDRFYSQSAEGEWHSGVLSSHL